MFTFHAIVSGWITGGILILAALPLFWLEWKRKVRLRDLRLLALVIVFLSLAGIFLRPHYTTERNSQIVLLTPGYRPQAVDSLLALYNDLTLLHDQKTVPYRHSRALESYHTLNSFGGDIRFVLGNGLPNYGLDLVRDKEFTFVPGNFPKGIVDISVRNPVSSNRENSIEGIFNNPETKTWLWVEGPGGVEDSTFIEGQGLQHFRLSFLPKQSGRFLYSIIAKTEREQLLTEKLPIEVREAEAFSVVFIQSYPTFETQYLKSYLARQDHRVTLRQKLSGNIYRYEYVNLPARPMNMLTTDILDQTDLLIIDSEANRQLSPAEANAIAESVRNGLGVLMLPVAIPDPGNTPLFPFTFTPVKTDTATVESAGKKVTLPALPVRVPYSPAVQPIVRNKSGVLSGYRYSRGGKIGFQFLQETYRLALSGDSLSYSSLWAPVIEGIARSKGEAAKISMARPFPVYPDQPVDIQMITALEDVVLLADSLRLPLREDVVMDGVWSARLWPGRSGWHSLQTDGGGEFFYYCPAPGEWQSLAIANQIRANINASVLHTEVAGKRSMVRKEVNPLVFYLLLLVSAGFIWLAPKL